MERSRTNAAQTRTQQSLKLARAAVDDMYIKVATAWLAKETAPSNIQQQLLTRALEVYQQLAQAPADDTASRRDAAVAFERCGETLGCTRAETRLISLDQRDSGLGYLSSPGQFTLRDVQLFRAQAADPSPVDSERS